MKNALLLIFTLLSLTTFAQSNLAVIPLQSSEIKLNDNIKKHLNYHSVAPDSLKVFIQNITLEKFYRDDVTIITKTNFDVFTDTIKRQRSKKGLVKNQKLNDFVYSNMEASLGKKYFALQLNYCSKEYLKELIEYQNLDYIIFLNKFQTKSKLFSKTTTFQLHLEVYDKHLNLVYGGKSNFRKRILKKTYPEIMQYHFAWMLESFYNKFTF